MSIAIRKATALILTLLMVFCISVPVFAETLKNTDSNKSNNSSQIQAQYLKELKLADDRIFSNYSKNITREEFVMLSVRLYETALGKAVVIGPGNPYSDISKSAYKKEILKAYKLKIISGSKNFNPAGELTRQEIAVMIFNTFKAIHPDWNFITKGNFAFKDGKDIAKAAREAVVYLYKNNIMRGPSELTISPKSKVTKEAALVLDFRAAFFSGTLFKLTEGDKSRDNSADGDDGVIEDPNTDNAEDYWKLGDAYQNNRFYNKAITAYNKAIELDPGFYEAYRERAGAYYFKREYDKALNDADKALGLNPDNGWNYAQRGRACMQLGKTDDAIKDATNGIELIEAYESGNTDVSWIFIYRAHCYIQKGLLIEAINDFKAAAGMNDNEAKDILGILDIK